MGDSGHFYCWYWKLFDGSAFFTLWVAWNVSSGFGSYFNFLLIPLYGGGLTKNLQKKLILKIGCNCDRPQCHWQNFDYLYGIWIWTLSLTERWNHRGAFHIGRDVYLPHFLGSLFWEAKLEKISRHGSHNSRRLLCWISVIRHGHYINFGRFSPDCDCNGTSCWSLLDHHCYLQ